MRQMTDESDLEGGSIDLDEFEAWVEETAETEGTSPEAVFQQLMSTHWILNELTETLEETPYESLIEAEAEGADLEEMAEEVDEDEAEERKSEIVEVIKSLGEFNASSQPQQPQQSSSIDPQLIKLVEVMSEKGGDGGDDMIASAPILYQEIQSLKDDIRELESEVESLKTRTSTVEDDLAEQIENTDEAIDSLEEEVWELREALESYEDLLEEIDEEQDLTDERVESIDDKFESAYSDIKQILSYLLDHSDEYQVVINAIVESYEEEIDELLTRQAEQQRLLELKREAAKRDISEASCQSCDERFEIGMLESPACPHCDTPLDGFDTKSSTLKSKHVARTDPTAQPRADSKLAERVERAKAELKDGADDAASKDFDFDA